MKENRIKILLIGSRYTGKGQIGRSWGQTDADLPALQPVIIYDRLINKNNSNFRVTTWVLSFDPEFEDLRESFYSNPDADGIIYTYDLTNKAGDTFEKVIDFRNEIIKKVGKLPPQIIFGIKFNEKTLMSEDTQLKFKEWATINGDLAIFKGLFYNIKKFDKEVEKAFKTIIDLII